MTESRVSYMTYLRLLYGKQVYFDFYLKCNLILFTTLKLFSNSPLGELYLSPILILLKVYVNAV